MRDALFDQATIERIADDYRRLVEASVADPDRRIGHIALAA